MKNPRIIAHFVAGYPSWEASLAVARGLIAGGAYALEMQIPFSDPSADGPVIEEACHSSLRAGFKLVQAWALVETLRQETALPIFIMSYASVLLSSGVGSFVQRAKKAGVNGFIVPDLSPGADEGLYRIARDNACPAFPVLIPSVDPARLEEILAEADDWIYVALRRGITGSYTQIGAGQEIFLQSLRARSLRVMAGFGIQKAEQVEKVTALADAVVVGSALVRLINAVKIEEVGQAVEQFLRQLRGSS